MGFKLRKLLFVPDGGVFVYRAITIALSIVKAGHMETSYAITLICR